MPTQCLIPEPQCPDPDKIACQSCRFFGHHKSALHRRRRDRPARQRLQHRRKRALQVSSCLISEPSPAERAWMNLFRRRYTGELDQGPTNDARFISSQMSALPPKSGHCIAQAYGRAPIFERRKKQVSRRTLRSPPLVSLRDNCNLQSAVTKFPFRDIRSA